MSPGGLAALLFCYRNPHQALPPNEFFLISGREECREMGLVKGLELTTLGRAHLKELCDLPVTVPEVKL